MHPRQPQLPLRRNGKINRLALASLALGIAEVAGLADWRAGVICAVLAVACGLAGLWQVHRKAEGGLRLAVAGMLLGILGLGWAALFLLTFAHACRC